MSMEYVRKTYGVPAKRGMWVEVYFQRHRCGWTLAKRGRITSASHHLHIDGGGPYHPTYGMVYLDREGGEILMDTRTPLVTPTCDPSPEVVTQAPAKEE